MNIEFSFTAFDNFEPLPLGKSKEILEVLPSKLREMGFSVVYAELVKLAAFDCQMSTKNLHKALYDRLQTYPSRKQFLIHLYDNIASSSFLLQDRARNEASFTSDARGYRPRKEPINPVCPITHTLTSPLPLGPLLPLLSNLQVELLDHEKIYVDNYMYYSSLTRSISSGVIPVLLYVPHDLASLSDGLSVLTTLCQYIQLSYNNL